ncbi:BH0509 family protein [Ureibacillus terrenus]|nr:BH0509 family protein [Ureibacillus terrenus]
MTREEREELIFICSLMSQYSEEYLKKLSDQELNEIYNKSMGVSLEKGE